MNRRLQNHLFWGNRAPLSSLTGGGLFILASNRVAYALVVCGALLWVYGLSALCACFFRPLFPKRGEKIILIFLSAFMGSLYLLLLSFINPMLVMGTTFVILLTPLCCIASGIVFPLTSSDPGEVFFRALLEALILGGLILALALIREPIGFASLSLPGGIRGIVEVFGAEGEGFFPVRVISVSAGAFFLLGYGVAFFRRFRGQDTPSEGSP
jgi:Na+-transporting NADH:ubiquinone oxidoreductase subunit NqrD